MNQPNIKSKKKINADSNNLRLFKSSKQEKQEKQNNNPKNIQNPGDISVPIFKMVYSKLVAAFVVIILITLTFLGVTLNEYFTKIYIEELENNLLQECKIINDLLPKWAEGNETEAINEMYAISRRYNAAIWVFSNNGNFLFSIVDTSNSDWQGKSAVTNIDSNYMQDIYAGNKIIGYGLFDDFYNQPLMTVGSPWIQDGEIKGAILLHSRVVEISAKVNEIMQSVIIAFCIAAALSVALISVIAFRFSKPLSSMSKVVNSIAQGNFYERVSERGGDEIAILAKSINSMANDLEGLDKMRRSFVANASHELKAPLASMRGFLEGIVDGTFPESDRDEYIGIVLEESKRLNLLINDLLDLSKIESGDFPLNKSTFNMNVAIVHAMITFEARIEERNMKVEFDLAENNSFVYADAVRIDQVVRNLVDNSIKYAGDGTTIFASTIINSGDLEIRIGDNGAGVSKDELKNIWDSFYTIDKAHTPGSDGTGLGLSIVKMLIQQHDRVISVESNVGKGTTFIFSLPLSKQDKSLDKTPDAGLDKML